ncbi:MAG: Hsp20/alpha crystallin family protein [Patescibacteria group bacterium]|jgi:HSP20 family protein
MFKKKNKKNQQEKELETLPIEHKEEAFDEEGQLSVDVYQDKNNIVIKSTIAGVDPDNIDISFHNDMLTIRGERQQDQTISEDDYFYKECYWGSFSRSIILPLEVQADKIKATIKNGILTIVLPKVHHADGKKISVEDDN